MDRPKAVVANVKPWVQYADWLERNNANLLRIARNGEAYFIETVELKAEVAKLREGVMAEAVAIRHLTTPHDTSARAVATRLVALLEVGE